MLCLFRSLATRRRLAACSLFAVVSELYAGPSNDNFADRAPLIVPRFATNIQTSNVGATTEPGEPTPCGVGRTLWWSWTAPESGRAGIFLTNGTATPCVRVYTGTILD